MTIHILPPEVSAQIAAGEVVERPASVVKELVENSLDADASTITIELLDGGRRMIRVADNGSGIHSNEVEIAVVRHATSKLTTIEDLNHLGTLGFRGEALATIASVSRMTLLTRYVEEAAGTKLYLEGGHLLNREAAGAPQGTIVTVENLFFNVPARLKFLKKEATERQLVGALVSRYAIAYPHIRFSLTHGVQEVLRTSGSGDLRQALTEVMGIDVVSQMLEVIPAAEDPTRPDLAPVQVTGYVGLPALNRSSRNQITLFVNGRWIQDSGLTYAVIQAYHTMLMVGRYPVATLLIEMQPEEVDVNVHPAKAQVRFRSPDAVFGVIQRAVRKTLIAQAPPPAARSEILWGTPEWEARRQRLTQISTERTTQLGLSFEDDFEAGQFGQQREALSDINEAPPKTAPKPRSLPMMRVVGQVGGTYIVSEGPHGLYLIDQHAAHERVLFEQFLAEGVGQGYASQELLEPVVVELAPDQMALLEDGLGDLEAIGFKVEIFGRNAARVRALPVLVAQSEPIEALIGALGDMECGEMPTDATREQKLISRVCKRAAVKAGQTLSYAEMEALVRQLEKCTSPQTCPHGRPTMLHISAEELAKQFGRLGAI